MVKYHHPYKLYLQLSELVKSKSLELELNSKESNINMASLSRQADELQGRMRELDNAIAALSKVVASSSTDEVDATKYVDEQAFLAVQGLLAQLQQENERLLGTAAHISHEVEVNTRHVKVQAVGDEREGYL